MNQIIPIASAYQKLRVDSNGADYPRKEKRLCSFDASARSATAHRSLSLTSTVAFRWSFNLIFYWSNAAAKL